MTEVTTERRKNVNLKRSKSVRASLRMIGNRFLHHNNKEKLPRSPSLQSLGFERHQVETILKTPQPEPKPTKCKKTDQVIPFTQPPPVVAPKAAAVLHIPTSDTVRFREHYQGRHSWFLHQKNDIQGRFTEFVENSSDNGGFHRGSLRLSITAKRRQGMWNSSFSSTSSRWWFRVRALRTLLPYSVYKRIRFFCYFCIK